MTDQPHLTPEDFFAEFDNSAPGAIYRAKKQADGIDAARRLRDMLNSGASVPADALLETVEIARRADAETYIACCRELQVILQAALLGVDR